MILATGCEPIAPPERTGMNRFDIEVETPRFEGAKAELRADEWILAHTAAFPHVDDPSNFDGCRFFLTLSCVTGWVFGDAYDSHRNWSPGRRVPAGTLFVVDLESAHWLYPESPDSSPFRKSDVWAGLQWWCKDARALKRQARRVVGLLGGVWVETDDPRYRKVRDLSGVRP